MGISLLNTLSLGTSLLHVSNAVFAFPMSSWVVLDREFEPLLGCSKFCRSGLIFDRVFLFFQWINLIPYISLSHVCTDLCLTGLFYFSCYLKFSWSRLDVLLKGLFYIQSLLEFMKHFFSSSIHIITRYLVYGRY